MVLRRLLLRSDQSIADLHYAIQIAMGWNDSHLNRFHIHAKEFGVAHERGVMFNDNPAKVQLADFGFRLGERFLYEYDFYDAWEHDVRLERVLPLGSRRILPLCIGGQRLAPPEDCGGARTYYGRGRFVVGGMVGHNAATRAGVDG
ncbi:MAG: plasmid pRiA4b ORF-3 family protein [Acidobacteriota bacterium]|nr:plasmid pRiA4b ORF-3 family protein [Acidobacteriota bacterium]